MKCKNCKQTLNNLLFFGLMQDLGAKFYPSVLECSKGVEHDFSSIESEDAAG